MRMPIGWNGREIEETKPEATSIVTDMANAAGTKVKSAAAAAFWLGKDGVNAVIGFEKKLLQAEVKLAKEGGANSSR